MSMLENQIISFSRSIGADCSVAVPVVFGKECATVYIEGGRLEIVTAFICDIDGAVIRPKNIELQREGYNRIEFGTLFTESELQGVLDDGELFRFGYIVTGGATPDMLSVPLVKVADMKDMSVIKYRCNEDAFGFPFSVGGYVCAALPILLSAPGYSQSDETYTKLDGEIVTLFSQARKEWSGETEYLPEELHDKIMVALMCDEVFINERKVVKSGQYSVDWKNYDKLPNGVKTAKATFTVEENMVSRNSNY